MRPTRATFDPQAQDFDRRVGLPPEAPAQVAAAVVEMAGLGAGEGLLEVGCGTGEIGVELRRELRERGGRYLGFDLSRGMLEVFRCRLPGSREVPGTSLDTSEGILESEGCEVGGTSRTVSETGILQADGNVAWPVAAGGVGAVFSSRAIHLLELEHVEAEVVRILEGAGGALLVGRVVRPGEAPGTLMRRELQRLLRQKGFEGRGGRKRVRWLLERCCTRGAALIEPASVCRWTVERSLGQSLAAWRRRQGLAGLELPEGIKGEILDGLEAWAEETFGPLTRLYSVEETYIVEGVRFSAA